MAGQVGQEAVQEIFRAYHGSGAVPSHVMESYLSSQEPSTMDLYFGPPDLRFFSEPTLSSPLRMEFTFLLRLSHDDAE